LEVLPLKVSVPSPAFVSASVPVPFVSTPLKLVFSSVLLFELPTMSVKAPLAFTVPFPAREPSAMPVMPAVSVLLPFTVTCASAPRPVELVTFNVTPAFVPLLRFTTVPSASVPAVPSVTRLLVTASPVLVKVIVRGATE
jgi:hypothetical protein